MNRLVPTTIRGQIQFFENHLEAWTAHAAELGLSPDQMADFAALVEQVREDYNEAEAARLASKCATMRLMNSLSTMGQIGAGCIKTIRGKAESSMDASVYSKALIPAPSEPTPSGIPPQPTDLRMSIDDGGAVNLAWNGSTRHNTYFTIWRKLPGEAGFTMIGTVGGKKWTDKTVSAGTPFATYFVKPHRGSKIGLASLQINMIFGREARAA